MRSQIPNHTYWGAVSPIFLWPKLWEVHAPHSNFGSSMSVQYNLDEVPRCACWKHLVAGFTAPDCPLKLSMPCIGGYRSKLCFSNVGAACQPVNIYDIEEGYTDFLKHVTDGVQSHMRYIPCVNSVCSSMKIRWMSICIEKEHVYAGCDLHRLICG